MPKLPVLLFGKLHETNYICHFRHILYIHLLYMYAHVSIACIC